MIRKKIMTAVAIAASLAFAACARGEKPTKTQTVHMEELNASGEMLLITQIQWYEEEDNQSYWGTFGPHQMAKGKQGYYFAGHSSVFLGNLFLGHMDAEGRQCVPVCSDAACAHDIEECVANFAGYEKQIWFYRDSLYAIKGMNGNSVLVRLGQDGTNRKELFEIGPVPVGGGSTMALAFCGDDVYAYDRATNALIGKEYGTGIRKRSLDGKTDETIIESKEMNALFGNARCLGGNLFFTYYTSNYDREKQIIVTESWGLYCYDCHTGKMSRLLDANVSDYAFDLENRTLYCFVMYEGLYAYNLDTGEKKLTYAAGENTQICFVSCDRQYLYLDNIQGAQHVNFDKSGELRSVTVLKKDGTIVNEIKSDTNVFWGDDNMLFAIGPARFAHEIGREEKGQYVYESPGFIKKSKIGSAIGYESPIWP